MALIDFGGTKEHVVTRKEFPLAKARKVLKKRGGENRQIFIITDGQPTAHVDGNFVYLIYPPDQRSATARVAAGGGGWVIPRAQVHRCRAQV